MLLPFALVCINRQKIFANYHISYIPLSQKILDQPLSWYSLMPRLLFTKRENSLVNCLYHFGSNI